MASGEEELESVVAPRLKAWLAKAKAAVMAPFKQHGLTPTPNGVYQEQGAWDRDVDTILTTIGKISMDAWNEATNVPPVSRHAFIMAHLADTRNLLVRIPDEVANGVFAEITDAMNSGASVGQIADAVDSYLDWSGSENWPNRARVIARTEANRARNAGTMAAATEMSRVTGRVLTKVWRSHHDTRVRTTPEPGGHVAADGQERPFYLPFRVGGEDLMYPLDPSGSPHNVINCRCDMVIRNEVA